MEHHFISQFISASGFQDGEKRCKK